MSWLRCARTRRSSAAGCTFILARGIGESFVARDVDEASVSAFLARELAEFGLKPWARYACLPAC